MNALESPNKLLYIFVALLLEHRIIFTSANLQRLTDCIFAALQLIYPFEWQVQIILFNLRTILCNQSLIIHPIFLIGQIFQP